MYCLAEHASKSAEYQFTNLRQLTSGAIEERAKFNLKILYLIRKKILSKNQRALSNREKLQKCLKFDFGCTVGHSMLQNLLKDQFS